MEPLLVEEAQGAILFDILVVPRSSRVRVGPLVGGRVKVSVTAPPVDGQANAAVALALASALGVRSRDVTIVSGQRGKRKRVRVDGASRQDLLALLEGRP